MGSFDPTTHPYCLVYVGNQQDVPLRYWNGIDGTGIHPVNPGDLIGTIETGIAGKSFRAASTGVRPALAAGGGVQGATGKSMAIAGDNVYPAVIHQNRRLFSIAVIQLDSGVTLATRPIYDNTNLQTNVRGFGLGTQAQVAGGFTGGVPVLANASSIRSYLNHNSGRCIELVTEEPVTDNQKHLVCGFLNPGGESFLQVDRGRKSYGIVDTNNTSDGNTIYNLFFLNRYSADSPFPGIVYAWAIYSAYPGDQYVQAWYDHFGIGAIAGSPEIRVGDHHLNFSRAQTNMPYCIWWGNKRITPITVSGSEHGEGTVFNDGISAPDGWCGSPHGNETVVSMRVWIDGTEVPYVYGKVYPGSTYVKVERVTEMGVSFSLTETTTITAYTKRVRARLLRHGDGRSINPLYAIRNGSRLENQDWQAFDMAGNLLGEGTITATDNSLVDMPYNPVRTIAVAQWSPADSLMVLRVMTKGYELDHRFVIVADDDNRRIYNRVLNATTENDVIEIEVLTKYYQTDAGSWKALAQSEVPKLLAEPPIEAEQGQGIIALQWAGLI